MAAYAALVSVMHIIDNLQLHPRPPISLHIKQLHSLIQKINFLLEFLQGYNPHLGYTAEADPLESRIADAAHAAEDVIESHIVDQITSDGKKMSSDALYEALEKVMEDMGLIEKEAMEIKETVGVQHQLHRKSTPLADSLRSSSIGKKKKSRMVGVDDVLYNLKDKLTSHSKDLQIIPIVGMGGLGKTTLALNLYQDRLIRHHFNICVWATISQEYTITGILAQLLLQLIDEEIGQDLSASVLGNKLYQHLYSRRFLIVLDDMWSIDAWDGIRNYFPNNKNSSRIVVTTRLSNLAVILTDSNGLEMKLLNEDHSWELLSKTVFGEDVCPLELEEIGMKIGKSCEGLPLSIVVVGGLLAKSKRTREFWEYIDENINSILNLEDDKRCLKILHMSYKQLPVYLKPCFLYMGVFREDEEINISKLIKSWVSEGFLKAVSGKSLEEIAIEYLKELIDRNLVLSHELGSIGNIKNCKIHDLLRGLCLREAAKERFYIVDTRPMSNPQRKRHIVKFSTTSENEAINSFSYVRSLIWISEDEEIPLPSFRLLRVLDSPDYRSSDFKENIYQLVNSRFLAFSTYRFYFSIWPFWNLQTLICGYHMMGDVTIPTDIWCMPHIRHVQLPGINLPDPPNGQDDIVLGNLQTLGVINHFKCNQQMVKRIPNIKKLKIRHRDDNYCLSNLDYLEKLECLSCSFFQEIVGMNQINFPHSLKKLFLETNESQCWEDILDKIGVLPLLQKLTLYGGSFRQGQWETAEGQFRSLRFLGLCKCVGLQVWTIESSHFPCLDNLLIRGLEELEEIPIDFAQVSALRVIDVQWCSEAVVVSAKRILEEQEELYGEEEALQVRVEPLNHQWQSAGEHGEP
ncbi:putative late blight resistance protein homolog R1A-10 [Salvia miltiorrhiza]|uniref:putative late blight resistance protein homolog R1A-10 n=1 Tax=Salvia miltiorrhiza TaxID=226208 RepID=UPI0025AC552A|nr:putative late blight resistance protein homolog R1A-10 [Salvia miltiorrhiza]XP_057786712.1 putative late blight resistance protein homolog R1A-10 [Salvia miltiorrhiza]